MIEKTSLIMNDDPGVFYQQLGEVIETMQESDLRVEIQYQQSGQVVSALVIGRG